MAIVLENSLFDEYARFLRLNERIVERCSTAITETAAGPIDSEAIVALYRALNAAKERIGEYVLLPGFVQYVKDTEANQAYDIAVEVASLQALISSALLWVETQFPKSAGWLLFLRIVDGVIEPRSFNSISTAGLRTELQAVVDFFTED